MIDDDADFGEIRSAVHNPSKRIPQSDLPHHIHYVERALFGQNASVVWRVKLAEKVSASLSPSGIGGSGDLARKWIEVTSLNEPFLNAVTTPRDKVTMLNPFVGLTDITTRSGLGAKSRNLRLTKGIMSAQPFYERAPWLGREALDADDLSMVALAYLSSVIELSVECIRPLLSSTMEPPNMRIAQLAMSDVLDPVKELGALAADGLVGGDTYELKSKISNLRLLNQEPTVNLIRELNRQVGVYSDAAMDHFGVATWWLADLVWRFYEMAKWRIGVGYSPSLFFDALGAAGALQAAIIFSTLTEGADPEGLPDIGEVCDDKRDKERDRLAERILAPVLRSIGMWRH
jgi:hypothetical protein